MRIKTAFFLWLMPVLFTLISCEKDDVCLSPTTPKLLITFNNSTNVDERSEVSDLTVISLPDNDTIYSAQTKDSIAIPLNVNANNCKYILAESSNRDTLQINYQREDVFVSKACGYKTIFHSIQIDKITDNQNWIFDLIPLQSNIIDEKLAHVKVLH